MTFFFLSQEVSKNLTKENEQIKEDVEEIRTEMSKLGKENCSSGIRDGMPDVRSALQRDAAAAYAHPEVRPGPEAAGDGGLGGLGGCIAPGSTRPGLHLCQALCSWIPSQPWSHFF